MRWKFSITLLKTMTPLLSKHFYSICNNSNIIQQFIMNYVQITIFFPLISTRALMNLKNVLEETEVPESTTMCAKNIVAAIYKHTGAFRGLQIVAKDNMVKHTFNLISDYR